LAILSLFDGAHYSSLLGYKTSSEFIETVNLTPLIPLSFSRRGEEILGRGRSPLPYLPAPFPLKIMKGRGAGG